MGLNQSLVFLFCLLQLFVFFFSFNAQRSDDFTNTIIDAPRLIY